MTFFEKTKRFLDPLLQNKLFATLSAFKYGIWAIDALVGVYIIRFALTATQNKDTILLEKYTYFFIGFLCIYLIFSFFIRKTDWPHLYHDLERTLYRKYIPKIIQLDNNYLESVGTGRLTSIVSIGFTRWIESSTDLLKHVTRIMIMGGVMFWIIFETSVAYGMLLIMSLILIQIFIIYLDSLAHKYRKIRTNEKNEGSRKLVRIIMSKNELLQNNKAQTSLDDMLASVDIKAWANGYINRSLFFMFNILRVFTGSIRVLVLLGIGYSVINGTVTQAVFAATLAMIIAFENFLQDFTEFYKNFTKDFSDIEKLWEVLDNGPAMQGYDSGSTFSPQKKDIEINSISYGYNEARVFDNFSLTIKRGAKTALVGASGGGKTTLMKLIAGYLHPESGSISVLGNQLDQTALKSYYPHIGYLTQDPSVFDATIRENLISAISQKDTEDNEQELINALKLAHCDFVFELEKGLDTEIGERGVRLSGGQKQRLAIAKIFLKDPEIILLDEPTSALDSFSEEAITVALDELFKNRTVIIVAHRLQTVRKADEIIVLEHGVVAERGNHSELVEKGGIYQKMLELQSGF